MKIALLTMTSLVVAISAACLGGGPVDVSEAEDLLSSGDLPASSASWAALEVENSESPEVLIGVAYDHVLSGNWDAADAALEKAQKATGDEDGSIQLRRALVILQSGENERLGEMQEFGKASGRPVGKLLAAEVHLVDAEVDEAVTLLKEIRNEPGAVGQLAENYIALIESADIYKKGLAEAEALWAVGMRDVAAGLAEEMLRPMPEEEADKAELLLLWAGRAVTSGNPGSATSMLDEAGAIGVPEGQLWRLQATRAMVFVADGQATLGAGILDALQDAAVNGQAPYEGIMDARATAAGLASSPADARMLAGEVESAEAARGLYQAGASRVARDAAPSDTTLRQFLENR